MGIPLRQAGQRARRGLCHVGEPFTCDRLVTRDGEVASGMRYVLRYVHLGERGVVRLCALDFLCAKRLGLELVFWAKLWPFGVVGSMSWLELLVSRSCS